MSAKSGQVELSRGVIAGAGATLLLMGMVAAAYGPLLPYLMQRFAIDISTAGLVFGVHFAGALLGVLVSMVTLARLSSRPVVSTSLALLALGCAGVALAPTWLLSLVAIFLMGIGFGQLDLGVNQLLAYSINPQRVALLNGLNGIFGIGAVVAPVLIAAAALRYAPLYLGGAVIALAALLAFRGLRGSLSRLEPSSVAAGGRAIATIAIFAAAFGLYVGVEVGVGGWMPTHLHSNGFSVSMAATITSGYWLAIAVGRFVIAPIATRLGDAAIVLVTTVLSVVLLIAALAPTLAAVAYVLTGFVIAPIFPTGVAWLARLNPGNPTATSWLFPAVAIGGAVIPSATGFAIADVGVAWVPAIFAAVALLSLLAFVAAARLAQTQFLR